VCLSTATYVLNRDRFNLRSQEYGCTEVPASALSLTSDLTATLASTTVTLTSEGRRSQSREVTVSAHDEAVGPVRTSSGRGSFRDGTCTYRYSYTERSAEVAGTITIDGTPLQESGFAAVGESTFSERCR
jgi:hypothetical protein